MKRIDKRVGRVEKEVNLLKGKVKDLDASVNILKRKVGEMEDYRSDILETCKRAKIDGEDVLKNIDNRFPVDENDNEDNENDTSLLKKAARSDAYALSLDSLSTAATFNQLLSYKSLLKESFQDGLEKAFCTVS